MRRSRRLSSINQLQLFASQTQESNRGSFTSTNNKDKLKGQLNNLIADYSRKIRMLENL